MTALMTKTQVAGPAPESAGAEKRSRSRSEIGAPPLWAVALGNLIIVVVVTAPAWVLVFLVVAWLKG